METPQNKNKPPLASGEGDSLDISLVTAAGNLAVQHAAQEPTAEAKSYTQEIADRVSEAERSHRAFLRQAIEQGTPSDELSAILAGAMNQGVVPKVVVAAKYRGSGVSLSLLDGVVPAEALRVRVARSPKGNIRDISTSLLRAADQLNGQNGFSYETTGVLPQHSEPGDPIDLAMLAKIDDYFPPTEQEAHPSTPE